MKTVFVLSLLAAFSGVSFGDSAVSSHAYLFPSDSDAKPSQIYVVVEQPGAVRFLTCTQPSGLTIPHSPAEVEALIARGCPSDLEESNKPGVINNIKLFHQKDSDRYVKIDNTIIWDASGRHSKAMDLGAFSRTVTFDNKAKDTLNILYVFQDTVDGQNPAVSTMRVTKFNAYDSEIRYPAITERPIEQ